MSRERFKALSFTRRAVRALSSSILDKDDTSDILDGYGTSRKNGDGVQNGLAVGRESVGDLAVAANSTATIEIAFLGQPTRRHSVQLHKLRLPSLGPLRKLDRLYFGEKFLVDNLPLWPQYPGRFGPSFPTSKMHLACHRAITQSPPPKG